MERDDVTALYRDWFRELEAIVFVCFSGVYSEFWKTNAQIYIKGYASIAMLQLFYGPKWTIPLLDKLLN